MQSFRPLNVPPHFHPSASNNATMWQSSRNRHLCLAERVMPWVRSIAAPGLHAQPLRRQIRRKRYVPPPNRSILAFRIAAGIP